jgi:hypothetical protein
MKTYGPTGRSGAAGALVTSHRPLIGVTKSVTSVTNLALASAGTHRVSAHGDTDVSDVTVRSAPIFELVTRRDGSIRVAVRDHAACATR